MTGAEIITRIRQNLEDESGLMYSNDEVYDAMNNHKDEVLALVQNYTDQYPQSVGTYTITSSGEVDLTATMLEPLYLESTRDGETRPRRHDLVGFRDKDIIQTNDNLYIRRKADGVWSLGKSIDNGSVEVTVYYVDDVDDLDTNTGTNTSFTFGPKPANQLIIAGATLDLLAARKRQDKSFWQSKVARLEERLVTNLSNLYKTGPDYVNYVED